jgi:hypothetical protein
MGPIGNLFSARAQIERLMDHCQVTQEEIAKGTHLHPSSVSRHLSGEMIPSVKNLREYSAYFSKLLKKPIHISRNATKRNQKQSSATKRKKSKLDAWDWQSDLFSK